MNGSCINNRRYGIDNISGIELNNEHYPGFISGVRFRIIFPVEDERRATGYK
jgi:hypothetical protein